MLPALLLALAAASSVSIEASRPAVIATLPRPVLALAFASRDRVWMLEEDRISFWRLHGETLARDGELLAESSERVRRPGGLINAMPGPPVAWFLRSGWSAARLVGPDDSDEPRLRVIESAVALPWPGAAAGLRFRSGTNLLDGEIDGLGSGPFLSVTLPGAAVDAANRLRSTGVPAAAQTPVGTALVQPWPDVVLVSAASSDATDTVSLYSAAAAPLPLLSLEGAIRALAAWPLDGSAVLLVALDTPDTHRVLRVELRRAPGAP